MSLARVRFEPAGVEIDVPDGTTVHAAAAEAGVVLEAPCGGLGTCGACRVRVVGGTDVAGNVERDSLSDAEIASGVRLACLARVEGPATVELSEAAGPMRVEGGLSTGGLRVTKGRTGLGGAVDVGTTTVALALFDLADGTLRASQSTMNSQTVFGHDVMTRIARAVAGDADKLRGAVAADIGRVLRQALQSAGRSGADLAELVVVGNPAMLHLLLGYDTTPLSAAPYTGALQGPLDLDASRAGFDTFGSARVHIGPGVSAFVGADAVAGMVATGLAGREHPAMLIDLGTNGEIVLQAGGRMVAASAAAGPAFEGVSISSGMRAEAGAIERVEYGEGGLRTATVEDTPARGVCGSGLLDAIATMVDTGAVDAGGLLAAKGPLADRVSSGEHGMRFELAPGVHLTQQDVRQVQLAKAAVSVAVSVLLEEAGVAADEVREIVVGGAFGSRIRPASLVRIGVLPRQWVERVTFHGNTALAGASAMLLDPDLRPRAAQLAAAAETISLATRPDFESRFLAALTLAEFDGRSG